MDLRGIVAGNGDAIGGIQIEIVRQIVNVQGILGIPHLHTR